MQRNGFYRWFLFVGRRRWRLPLRRRRGPGGVRQRRSATLPSQPHRSVGRYLIPLWMGGPIPYGFPDRMGDFFLLRWLAVFLPGWHRRRWAFPLSGSPLPHFSNFFFLQPAPFRDVVGDPHWLELFKVGQFFGGDFIKLQRFMPSKQDNFLGVVQPEKLVRQHERPLGVGTGLAVRPGTVKNRGKEGL